MKKPTFLISLTFPFDSYLQRMDNCTDLRFEQVFLESKKHWIFRLLGESEQSPPQGAFTCYDRIQTGLWFNTPYPIRRIQFAKTENPMVALHWAPAEKVVIEEYSDKKGNVQSVYFEWYEPNGELFEKSDYLTPGEYDTNAWATLNHDAPLKTGRWRVRGITNGKMRLETYFIVQ